MSPEGTPKETVAPAKPPLTEIVPSTDWVLALMAKAIDSPFMQAIRHMPKSRLALAAIDNPFRRLAKQMQEDATRWQNAIAAIQQSALMKVAEDIARQSEAWRLATTTAAQTANAPWLRLQKTLI